MNRAVLLTGILFSFSVYADAPTAPASPAPAEEPRQFNIEAGEAPTTLNQYCEQADKQVLFDYQELRHRLTHRVAGMLTPSEALKVMLQDTGLVADSVNEQTLAVMTK
jgi:hypothetical protein